MAGEIKLFNAFDYICCLLRIFCYENGLYMGEAKMCHNRLRDYDTFKTCIIGREIGEYFFVKEKVKKNINREEANTLVVKIVADLIKQREDAKQWTIKRNLQ